MGATITNCTAEALLGAIGAGGEITLSCEGTITLTNTAVVATDTTLQATGSAVVISGGSSGTNGVRLFSVRPGVRFTLKNVSLINGRVVGENGALSQGGERAGGAAILNEGGSVALVNITLSNHSVTGGDGGAGLAGASGGNGKRGPNGGAGVGAALYNDGGTMLLDNVRLIANAATGGRGGEGGAGGTSGNGGNGGDGGEAGIGGGAAIFNGGNGILSVVDCTFASNRVTGGIGGIGGASGGGLGITGRNGASGSGMGAAIYVQSGLASVSNSTFTQNTATGGAGQHEANGVLRESDGYDGTPGASGVGGAIFNQAGSATLTNCTFVANAVIGGDGGNGGDGNTEGFGGDGGKGGEGGDASGGALSTGSAGNTVVVSCTFGFSTLTPGQGGKGGAPGTPVTRAGEDGALGTTVASALYGQGGPFTVKNSILSGAQGVPAVSGSVSDAGFNLVTDASLAIAGTGTRLNINPLLDSLSNDGGSTATLAISSNSPAIDAITNDNGCPATDQRHAPRSGPCDIGAFEFGATAPGIPLEVQLQSNSTGRFVELAWPITAAAVLQTSGSTLTNWVTVTTAPTIRADRNVVGLPATNQQGFFRLRSR